MNGRRELGMVNSTGAGQGPADESSYAQLKQDMARHTALEFAILSYLYASMVVGGARLEQIVQVTSREEPIVRHLLDELHQRGLVGSNPGATEFALLRSGVDFVRSLLATSTI